MAKKQLYRDNLDEGGYIALYFTMIDHPAFRELSEASIRVLIQCHRKAFGAGRYNKIFKFTYPEAKNKLNMSSSTFQRAIKQLHSLGFIDYWSPGGLRNEQKTPKGYQLSLRWKRWGGSDFVDHHEGYFRCYHV